MQRRVGVGDVLGEADDKMQVTSRALGSTGRATAVKCVLSVFTAQSLHLFYHQIGNVWARYKIFRSTVVLYLYAAS